MEGAVAAAAAARRRRSRVGAGARAFIGGWAGRAETRRRGRGVTSGGRALKRVQVGEPTPRRGGRGRGRGGAANRAGARWQATGGRRGLAWRAARFSLPLPLTASGFPAGAETNGPYASRSLGLERISHTTRGPLLRLPAWFSVFRVPCWIDRCWWWVTMVGWLHCRAARSPADSLPRLR